jgi:hypothetical protein
MARVYRSSDIIESAKRKAMLPETQVTFTDQDFLAFANEEMDLAIIPFILSFREDYYQNSVTIPLESDKKRYTIPYRAIGNKIRDVQYVDSSGKVFPLRRIFVEDLHKFDNGFTDKNISNYNKYYIENDEIVLLSSTPQISGSLKIIFYLRPNALVLEDEVYSVVSIAPDLNPNNKIITLDKTPTTLTVGELIDFVEQKSPCRILKYDVPILAKSGNTITVAASNVDARLNAGDQVSKAEQTALPQLPAELQSLLAQRVAARCLEAIGDQQGLQAANAKIAEIEQKVIPILDNRVDGSPMKVNANLGLLKSICNYWRR